MYAQVRSKYGLGHKYGTYIVRVSKYGTNIGRVNKYGTNIGPVNKYGIMGQVEQARIQAGPSLCLGKTKEQFLHGDTVVFDRCANIFI